ncbi:MAG: Flp pilus assembly complex ATPase component TadA [Burkholderiaceae bacterium]|nr:Flp pilus assembly complex ATPase component TadA [Burkholderiaceae bacterium]
MITITIDADGETTRTMHVERFPCRIGRHRDADIALSGWRIARAHAEIRRLALGYKLVDLGSIGGTWVNGERVVEYAPLTEVDEISIAGYRIRVVAGEEDACAHPMVAPPMASATRSYVQVASPRRAARGAAHLQLAGARSTETVERDEHAQRGLEARRILHRRLLQTIDLRRKDIRQLSSGQLRAEARAVLVELLQSEREVYESVDQDALLADVLDEAVGLGPLERLMADPSVSEIMVNGPDAIYVEREGRISRSALAFSGEAAVRSVIDRVVAPLGRRIDESSPMVDARLPDGSRVNAVIPPLAVRGTALTIRRFNRQLLDPADLIHLESASWAMVAFLQLCVEHRRNVVISGGTGSGKTTLLNLLSNLIPAHERVVTIEDAAELRLEHEHLVSLEARPSNAEGRGAVGIRDLVRNALRMRPDRIVVGECRGGEALDMLQAMNTGHDGSLTTVHANSPRDVISRLETMVMMAGLDLPVAAIRDQVASAIQIIVQQARDAAGRRRIVEISEVTGLEGTRVQMQALFRWERGAFVACGAVPQFFEALRANGVAADWNLLVDTRCACSRRCFVPGAHPARAS